MRRAAIAAAAWALALACGPAATPRGAVVVVIDTLRADHLGSYGYPRPTSPRIDALARDATLFEQALAPSPWTLPSLGSLMTGLYPSVHGALRPSPVDNLEWAFEPESFRPVSALHESRRTLAEMLSAAGFATAGFVQGSYASSSFGIGQGFDLYRENATPGVRFDVEEALRWLDERVPERFLLYLHVIEVHAPYAPAELRPGLLLREPDAPMDAYRAAVAEEAERFASLSFDPDYAGSIDGSMQTLLEIQRGRRPVSQRDLDHLVALYDQGIAYTDHWIGVLLDGLAARGLYDQSVIVVTSDHGEEFLEHGRLQHSLSFYEEMLRVPLIVRVPGEGAGRRVAAPVGLVDVLPTVLGALGVAHEGPLQGRSLLPLLRGGSLPERAYFGEASMLPGLEAVRTGRHKYIRHRKRGEELYDLSADPDERRNRCRREPALCARLASQLGVFSAEAEALETRLALPEPEEARVDDALRERLRELGYVDGP